MNKKEIKGLEPYMADDKGNIYGLSDNVLKPIYRGRNKAYAGVDIYGKTYSVHRLVAYAFGLLSSIEYDGNMIDHINEVKDDTTLASLGIDSLDVYNLFIELEMKTGRNVSDNDVDKLSTINSIVEYFS